MSKRAIASVVLVVVVGIGLWLVMRSRDNGAMHVAGGRGSAPSIAAPRRATDPTTGVPAWLGQHGLEGRRIAGTVIDEVGRPVRGATVRLANSFTSAGLFTIPSKVTDDTGSFDFGRQPASKYVVSAEGPRLTAAVQRDNVAAGRTGIALRIVEPGGIDGTLVGFTGAPEVSAYRGDDMFGHHRAKVTSTTFQLRNLPPGKYFVSAIAGRQRARVTVEVTAGAIQTVTLQIAKSGTIAGIVRDAKTKAPIAGLECMSGLVGEDSYGSGVHPKSDVNGAFRLEDAPAGSNKVGCSGTAGNAWGTVAVASGQVAQVVLEVTARPSGDDDKPPRTAGLTVENQLSEVLVETVTPGSPAARAGVAVGDVLVSVDGETIGPYRAEMAILLIERRGKSDVKLVLERADKQLAVTLKF